MVGRQHRDGWDRRGLRLLIGGAAGVAAAATLGLTAGFAFFAATDGSNAHTALASAGSVGAGQQPALVSVSGRDVTISWGAAANASSYSVARSNVAPQALPTVEHGTCAGASGGTQCQDTGLPESGGAATSWTYTDTPLLAGWSGTTSDASSTVTVPGPGLSLLTGTFTADGGSTTATVTSYFDAEGVTFCLDQSTVPCTTQLGTATVPASGGTASGAIAIPAGTSVGPHTVYAVGSNGSDASAAVSVSAGAATQLVFTTEPAANAGVTAGAATTFAVSVEDAHGNVETADGSTTVNLALGSNPGSSSITCSNSGGTGPVAVTGGVATFSCSFNKAASGYTVTATSNPAHGTATSNAFNVVAAAASQVVFTSQPGGGPNGVPWAVQPVVAVEDSFGNVVTSDTSSVKLTVKSQPSGTATLSCTGGVSKGAVSGVASFSGCQIVGPAGSYTLKAADGSLNAAVSSGFSITTGSATQLVFTTPPGGGANGASWSTQPSVSVEDSGGNVVTTDTSTVTLSINSQPSGGASLTCTGGLSKAAANGVAAFSGCQIVGKAGAYTLKAVDGSLTAAVSASFSITTGSATQLVFTTQPGGGANGAAWPTQPVLTVEDSGGNTVTGSSASVTLAIASQPGSGASLSCTANPKAASSGVATFAGCAITGTAGSYTISASSSGLSSATSNSFSITAGAAAKLVFTTQPGSQSGGALSTQPAVTVEDTGGNVVANSSANISLAIGTNPTSGAALQCSDGSPTALTVSPSMAASAGVAAFSGCGITKTGTGFTLTATSSGLTGATSSAFNVTSISAPTITSPTSGSPETVAHGSQATFTITGANFASGAVVTVSGGFTVNTVTWVDASHISVTVTAGNGNNSKGTWALTLTNPDAGTATSSNSMVNS
jgi:hypothetical protein